MNYKARWGSDEHAEYDALIEDALALDGSNSERSRLFAEQIESAADQAHRPWAREVQSDAKKSGYHSIFRREARKATVLVNIDGLKHSKPAAISIHKTRADGSRFQQLAFFETLSREQIAEKRREYLAQRRAYDTDIAMMDALTSFMDAAETDSVPDAERVMGVTAQEWLEAGLSERAS